MDEPVARCKRVQIPASVRKPGRKADCRQVGRGGSLTGAGVLRAVVRLLNGSGETPLATEVTQLLRGAWRPGPAAVIRPGGPSAAAVALLLRSGTGALAWHAVGRPTDGRCDALRQAYRLHTLQAALHDEAVATAFRRLRALGVEPLLGKGWAAARLYPEPALRPYGDVDLYFDVADYDRLRREAPAEPEGVAADRHRGASFLDDRPWAELWQRSQTLPLGDQSVRSFGPEHHLRLLALHFLASGAWRPLWLCDVGAALETRPAEFDWDLFLAGAPRRTQAACAALGAAAELVGASLDGVPLAARMPLPAWFLPAVLRQWGRRDFQPHGQRVPFTDTARTPAALWRALRLRWPDPIEATLGTGAPFDSRPRLPYQLAECLRRLRRAAQPPTGASKVKTT
jgi:hypothetical protein